MIRYEREGVVITETRKEGLTLAQAITQRYQLPEIVTYQGRWPFQKKQVEPARLNFDLPPTPDLRFENFPYLAMDTNRKNVLAICTADNQSYLVRNDQILLQTTDHISLEDCLDDFSGIVTRVKASDESYSIQHFDEAGDSKLIVAETNRVRLLRYYDNSKGLIYMFAKPTQTKFSFFSLETGHEDYQFTVDKPLDFDRIFSVHDLQKDDAQNPSLIWNYRIETADPEKPPTDHDLYRNEELLASNVCSSHYKVSSDHRNFIAVSLVQDGKKQIVKNGQTLGEIPATEGIEIVRANDDISTALVAVTKSLANDLRVYYLINGKFDYLPLEGLRGIRFVDFGENEILFEAFRKGALYNYRIKAEGGTADPQITESEAA